MGDITTFRVLVQPRVQAKAIADLVAAIAAADLDGINIDFEPPNPKHPDGSLNPESPLAATIEDGLKFANFLDALSAALHRVPGRRRLVSMDGGSVAGACWSVGPLDHGKRNHTWDLSPCPWITRIWNLDALAASKLDVMIPMDTYTANSTEVPYITWIYQKYFKIDRIGWGLYPTKNWPDGESQGPFAAASDEVVTSRMDRFEVFGSRWISLWSVDPGTGQPGGANMSTFRAKMAPWLPRLRRFLQSKTDDSDHLSGGARVCGDPAAHARTDARYC